MIVKNNINEIEKIYEELIRFSEANKISQRVQNDLCLCMDEMFSNIVNYAYDDDDEHLIEINFFINEHEKKLSVIIKDDGKAFNPLDATAPDLTADPLEREIGGLGLFIVKNIMSCVKYNRDGHINNLEMIKDLSSE